MTNLRSLSDQNLPRLVSPQLTLHQQSIDAYQHQSISPTQNHDDFSVAESALLLGAFATLAVSILSFATL